jgi:hypothetical protein
MVLLLKLIAMVFLGLLSAALSYYNKNYYVRVFNDILGLDEDEQTATRIGRGFVYGFLFPIFFCLGVAGLVALVVFLVIAAILAAIAYALVWLTEKVVPNEAIGNAILKLFAKLPFGSGPVETGRAQAQSTESSNCCASSGSCVTQGPNPFPGSDK